jgi:hypothetical protein
MRPIGNCWTCGSTRALHDTGVESGAIGHGATPDPIPAGKWALKPRDTWWHQSPPQPEARSRATRHVATSVLPSAGRQGSEPLDLWQHQNPPRQGSGVRSRRARGSTRAHLGREAGSRGIGQVVARECTPYPLSSLEACTWGYPVCRVPTGLTCFTWWLSFHSWEEMWRGYTATCTSLWSMADRRGYRATW